MLISIDLLAPGRHFQVRHSVTIKTPLFRNLQHSLISFSIAVLLKAGIINCDALVVTSTEKHKKLEDESLSDCSNIFCMQNICRSASAWRCLTNFSFQFSCLFKALPESESDCRADQAPQHQIHEAQGQAGLSPNRFRRRIPSETFLFFSIGQRWKRKTR
jgi:hypothetical protein